MLLALVGGLEKSFVEIRVLVLGWFGCWQVYCLFTVGECIVCVYVDSVLVCVRGYCFGVLRYFFLRVYVCMYAYVCVYLCPFE